MSGTPERLVTVEQDGDVLLIGVDRAKKRNAWNLQVIREVARAYEQLADGHARVGVVFGHGEHFSAGLDLAEVLPAVQEQGPDVLGGAGRFDPFGLWNDAVPKPVVLAVQGIAFTLSIELALASDVVVAADDVRFRQLEIGRGIMPFGGATIRAPQQLGWGNAMRWLLTAEEFGAKEAHRIGLVQEVVPAGSHVERAVAIARTIAEQAPLGVRGTLQSARTAVRAGDREAAAEVRRLLPGLVASSDAAEGVQSFLERRQARFTGS
ncbi:MAG TPA: crotonase/enoyl-CoA hydratase family protein [Mycobacteriales bacterium]|nr:crotonase/enoyl-CoA hydratase family protein [Mycobacteriales bacterium]